MDNLNRSKNYFIIALLAALHPNKSDSLQWVGWQEVIANKYYKCPKAKVTSIVPLPSKKVFQVSLIIEKLLN